MAEKIAKQEAVRRALAALGNDAKPAQMRGWIKEQFDIEMSTDHISTAKGEIRRKARGGKKAPARKPAAPAAEKKEAPRPQAQPQAAGNGKEAGIPLHDILYVKQLVGRFGPDQLHTLIDSLAK